MAESPRRRKAPPPGQKLDLPAPYTALPSTPAARRGRASDSLTDAVGVYREVIATANREIARCRRTGQSIAPLLTQIRSAQARIDVLQRESETNGERAAGTAERYRDILERLVKERFPELALPLAEALREASTTEPADPVLERPAGKYTNPYLARYSERKDDESEETTT